MSGIHRNKSIMQTTTESLLHLPSSRRQVYVESVPMDVIKTRYCPGEGRHFFDPSSCRFFRSRMPHYGFEGPGGCYFVTSEQFVSSDGIPARRRYTVRQLIVAPWGSGGRNDIRTIGEFNKLSRCATNSLARKLAADA